MTSQIFSMENLIRLIQTEAPPFQKKALILRPIQTGDNENNKIGLRLLRIQL